MYIESFRLDDSVIKEWDARFSPSYDFFYFKSLETLHSLLGNQVLIFLRDELNHEIKLNTLNTRTAFSPWLIDQEAKYVAVVPNEQFAVLEREKRKRIFRLQHELERGLIYSVEWMQPTLKNLPQSIKDEVESVLAVNRFETEKGDQIAFQKEIWVSLPFVFRKAMLKKIAGEYVETEALWGSTPSRLKEKMKQENPFIHQYFDAFPKESGPNCFATVIAALAQARLSANWIMDQWLHPDSFKLMLRQNDYKWAGQLDDSKSIKSAGVLVWTDSQQNPVHACYSLGDNYAFNKSGQTMFQPWCFCHLEQVIEDWEDVRGDGGSIDVYLREGKV